MASFGDGWAAAVGLALVVALSGCTTPGEQHGHPARTLSVVAACDGVADCHYEISADVDGDGRPDEVAVVGHPLPNDIDGPYWSPDAGAPTLRVATARSVLTYRVILGGPVFGHVVLGAAQIDGIAGDELLVGFLDGAHGHSATIVTDHGAGLRTLPAPDPYSGKPGTLEGSWGSDSSIMSNLGWHCLPGGQVEEFIAEGEDGTWPVRYTMWHQTWRWRDSTWWPVGKRWLRKHAPVAALTAEYDGWTDCGSFVAERPYG